MGSEMCIRDSRLRRIAGTESAGISGAGAGEEGAADHAGHQAAVWQERHSEGHEPGRGRDSQRAEQYDRRS